MNISINIMGHEGKKLYEINGLVKAIQLFCVCRAIKVFPI